MAVRGEVELRSGCSDGCDQCVLGAGLALDRWAQGKVWCVREEYSEECDLTPDGASGAKLKGSELRCFAVGPTRARVCSTGAQTFCVSFGGCQKDGECAFI